jgi:hypothetical protein
MLNYKGVGSVLILVSLIAQPALAKMKSKKPKALESIELSALIQFESALANQQLVFANTDGSNSFEVKTGNNKMPLMFGAGFYIDEDAKFTFNYMMPTTTTFRGVGEVEYSRIEIRNQAIFNLVGHSRDGAVRGLVGGSIGYEFADFRPLSGAEVSLDDWFLEFNSGAEAQLYRFILTTDMYARLTPYKKANYGANYNNQSVSLDTDWGFRFGLAYVF